MKFTMQHTQNVNRTIPRSVARTHGPHCVIDGRSLGLDHHHEHIRVRRLRTGDNPEKVADPISTDAALGNSHAANLHHERRQTQGGQPVRSRHSIPGLLRRRRAPNSGLLLRPQKCTNTYLRRPPRLWEHVRIAQAERRGARLRSASQERIYIREIGSLSGGSSHDSAAAVTRIAEHD